MGTHHQFCTTIVISARKALKEFALWVILLALLTSLLQTEHFSYYYHDHPQFKIYFWVSTVMIMACAVLLMRIWISKESFIPPVIQKFKSLSIPKGAKVLIVVALTGNLIAIGLGKSRYPFYDVGMFRWAMPFHNNDKVMRQLKYYYWKNGECKILDLRKEGSYWLAEILGAGYTEEFMFSARYRNRGEQKNFEFLSTLMKDRGIDTLWSGVHSVNFETGEISFDPDICNAVSLNETVKQYYGPLFIPDYQVSRCHDQHR
jgi:hypothetical protein